MITIIIPSKSGEIKNSNLSIQSTPPVVAVGEQKLWLQTNIGGDPNKITLNLITGT